MEANGLQIADCFPGNEVDVDRNEGTDKKSSWAVRIDRDDQARRGYERNGSRLKRAKAEGRIELFTADAFCIEALRVHPCAVYGSAWFEFGEVDEAEEMALCA